MTSGFVKSQRSLLDNPAFRMLPPIASKVLWFCTLRANWKPSRWCDTYIPAGGFVFSHETLADLCNQQIEAPMLTVSY
jgi:hypothetical protein